MKKLILSCAFFITLSNVHSQNVIYGEYFIDSEPGFGNATPIPITLPDSDVTQTISIPANAFPDPGYHHVFIRTLDATGNWSMTKRKTVEVGETISAFNVIKVEYFFDADAGFGDNSFVQLDASSDSTWNFNIPVSDLPPAWSQNDTLFLRSLDSIKGNWSLTTRVDSLNFTWVGIDKLEEASGVSVFPNPFSEELTVTPNVNQEIRLMLYGENGQVEIDRVIDRSTKINTEQLAKGAYIIIVYGKKQSIYRSTIIKQ